MGIETSGNAVYIILFHTFIRVSYFRFFIHKCVEEFVIIVCQVDKCSIDCPFKVHPIIYILPFSHFNQKQKLFRV